VQNGERRVLKERNKLEGKKDRKNYDSLVKEFHLKILLITIKSTTVWPQNPYWMPFNFKEDVIGRIKGEKRKKILVYRKMSLRASDSKSFQTL